MNEENTDIWLPISSNDKLQKRLMSNGFMIKQTKKSLDSIDLALQFAGFKVDNKKIKTMFIKWIKNIPEYEFASIINEYKQQKLNNEFISDWNPFYIKNKNDFIKEIKRLSFRFRGDDITLALLKDIMKIDFIIIKERNIKEISNATNERLVILNYNIEKIGENEFIKESYEIIGFKPTNHKKTKSIFKKELIPLEIKRLLSMDDTFLYHIQNVCKKDTGEYCEIKSLHTILAEIEEQMGDKIPPENRNRLIQVLYTWIKNNDYLKNVKNN